MYRTASTKTQRFNWQVRYEEKDLATTPKKCKEMKVPTVYGEDSSSGDSF